MAVASTFPFWLQIKVLVPLVPISMPSRLDMGRIVGTGQLRCKSIANSPLAMKIPDW